MTSASSRRKRAAQRKVKWRRVAARMQGTYGQMWLGMVWHTMSASALVYLGLLTPDEWEGGEGQQQHRVGGHQGDQQPRVRHVVRVDGPAGRGGWGAYSVWERMNRMAEMVSRPMMVDRKMSFIRK